MAFETEFPFCFRLLGLALRISRKDAMKTTSDRDYDEKLGLEFSQIVGLLTAEEWRTILSPFPQIGKKKRRLLARTIRLLVDLYQFEKSIDPIRPSLTEHRRTLKRVFRGAFTLKAALSELDDGTLWRLLSSDSLKDDVAEARVKEFKLRLGNLLRSSNAALGDRKALARVRLDVGVGAQSSLEARTLWSFFFWIWFGMNGSLSYTLDGPLQRLIEKIQIAAGGPPINPETLKKSAQRWKAREMYRWGPFDQFFDTTVPYH